jgi:hypothetical protein
VKKRRETFILATAPGRGDEARTVLSEWLHELDGRPGYLGGVVLSATSKALPRDTVVLQLDFESTEELITFYQSLKEDPNPIYPDDKSSIPPDQGGVIFTETDGDVQLTYDRNGAMFAQLLHVHAHVFEDFSSSAAAAR